MALSLGPRFESDPINTQETQQPTPETFIVDTIENPEQVFEDDVRILAERPLKFETSETIDGEEQVVSYIFTAEHWEDDLSLYYTKKDASGNNLIAAKITKTDWLYRLENHGKEKTLSTTEFKDIMNSIQKKLQLGARIRAQKEEAEASEDSSGEQLNELLNQVIETNPGEVDTNPD